MSPRSTRRERPALEIALYAIVCAAPLAIGSVHPPTQLVLLAASLVLLVVTGITATEDRGVRIPPFAWVPLAALVWTALALVPLPLAVLRLLSPHAAALREESGAHFAPLTLDVSATVLELCKLSAAICVLLVCAEILRHRGRRVTWVFAILGGVVAVLVWVHRLGGVEKIYGFYVLHVLPGTGFFAPFVNGNNAASLLSLCALAAAGAAFGRTDQRGPILGVLALAAAATTLGTMSRGGALGLACGAFFLVAALASERFGRAHALSLSLTVVVLLGAGGLVLADGLRGRLNGPGASITDNQKTRGWVAGLRLSGAYPLTGVGRGAFEAPAASLRLDEEAVRLVYPENVVVQVVSEWGWPVGLALLVGLVVAFIRTLRHCRLDPPLVGLTAGVIAVAVHELFDFGLEFPGVSLPLTLAIGTLVACSEADDRTRRRRRPRLRKLAWVPVVLGGVALLFSGLQASRHTLAVDLEHPADVATAIARHPASAELELEAATQALARRDPDALHHLNRAMTLQPSSWRPHALAAVQLERLGRYGQAALEYRLARGLGAPIDDHALVRRLGRYALDAMQKTVEDYERCGGIYAQLERYDDATSAYERAADLDGGSTPRLAWLSWMPPARKPEVLDTMQRLATTDSELANVVTGWAALGDAARAEKVFAEAALRFPRSAPLAIAGARMRLARNDLEGARKAIGYSSRIGDPVGRVHAEELLAEIAERSGDPDQVEAAKARLRLLRAKAHMEEPAGGGTP